MPDIATNATTVRGHYEKWFEWLDRGNLNEVDGRLVAPIMNIGYWADADGDPRAAQVAMVNLLASRMPGIAGAQVLDAGCGVAGPATILARDHGARVTGINFVPAQLQLARQYISAEGLDETVQFSVANAMRLPFKNGSFDFVFNLEAAHCFADKAQFLREVHRVLRPGGRYVMADIVATSHAPLIRYQPALKLNLITAGDWRDWLEEAGLRVEEQTMIGRDVYPQLVRWLSTTAGERRGRIYRSITRTTRSPVLLRARRGQAWVMELALCRSVLAMGGLLRLRGYVLQVAGKPS